MASSCDVAFGHTAKLQYRQIRTEADPGHASPAQFREATGRLHRTRLLLAQISDLEQVELDQRVIDVDRAFPFQMWYRSEGSTFVYYRRVEIPHPLVIITYLCEFNSPSASAILLNLIAAGHADALAALGIPSAPLSRSHMMHVQ
jgi:hypothetical protein